MVKNVVRRKAGIFVFLVVTGTLLTVQASDARKNVFDNHYLTITLQPGWTARESANHVLTVTHGGYVLSINPMFTHASGGICGRFSEITGGMPSIDAVMKKVDQPAGGWECSALPLGHLRINEEIELSSLYTDSSKSGSGCTFPANEHPVWFGSFFCGEDSESEYTITLAYNTADVNGLPDEGDPELQSVFRDVAAMLNTLGLKPPLLISKVSPSSAPAGTVVTVHGSGFNLPKSNVALVFKGFPNNPMPSPIVAKDGKSLTFQVPTSMNTISCPIGRFDVKEGCVPIPPNHVDINDCPQKKDGSTNFCGIPMPSASYEIYVTLEGTGIRSNSVPFVITPQPTPVSVLLVSPNSFILPGDTVTLRGQGFVANQNTVQIGSAVLTGVPSSDGKTITFQAPQPSGTSFIPGIRIYEISVSNANGQSNPIAFEYR